MDITVKTLTGAHRFEGVEFQVGAFLQHQKIPPATTAPVWVTEYIMTGDLWIYRTVESVTDNKATKTRFNVAVFRAGDWRCVLPVDARDTLDTKAASVNQPRKKR